MHYPVYTAWWRWTSTAASVPYRSRSATRTRECTVPRVWPPCTCTSPCTRNQRRLPTMTLWCRFGRSISPLSWGYRQARPYPAASDRHGAQRHFGVASDGAPPPSLGLQTGVTCPASSDRHGARSPKAPPLDQDREFVQSIAPPIGLQAGVTIFCPGSSVRLSASQGLEVPGVRL